MKKGGCGANAKKLATLATTDDSNVIAKNVKKGGGGANAKTLATLATTDDNNVMAHESNPPQPMSYGQYPPMYPYCPYTYHGMLAYYELTAPWAENPFPADWQHQEQTVFNNPEVSSPPSYQ